MRSLVHLTRASSLQRSSQLSFLTILETKRGRAKHTPAAALVAAQMLVVLGKQELNEPELAVTHVDKVGTQMQLSILLPERWARELGGDRRDVAGAEVASAVPLAAEANPRFQLGVVVGLVAERQQPLAVACPLEPLRVQGEGPGGATRRTRRGCGRQDATPHGALLPYGGWSPRYTASVSVNAKSLPAEAKKGSPQSLLSVQNQESWANRAHT